MDAKILEGVKVSEESLARKAKEESLKLPEGHPLEELVAQQKAKVGDLADLPDNHPLVLAIQNAKGRYEEAEAARQDAADKEADGQQSVVAAVKKAKRLDAKKVASERRMAAEEKVSRKREAAQNVNGAIDEMIRVMEASMVVVESNEEVLSEDALFRSRVNRLERLMHATLRGLSSSRLNANRMVTDG